MAPRYASLCIRHVPRGFPYISLIITPRVLRLLLSLFVDEGTEEKEMKDLPKAT